MIRNFIVTLSENGHFMAEAKLRYEEENDACIRAVFKNWANDSLGDVRLMRVQSMPVEGDGLPKFGPIYSFFYRSGYRVNLGVETVRFKHGYMIERRNRKIHAVREHSVRSIIPTKSEIAKEWVSKTKSFLKNSGNEIGEAEISTNFPSCCWFGEILLVGSDSLYLFSDKQILGVSNDRKRN